MKGTIFAFREVHSAYIPLLLCIAFWVLGWLFIRIVKKALIMKSLIKLWCWYDTCISKSNCSKYLEIEQDYFCLISKFIKIIELNVIVNLLLHLERKKKKRAVCLSKKRIPLTFVSAKEYENRWINFCLLFLLHWLSILFVEQFFLYFLYFLRTLNCRYVTLSESFQFPLFDGALFERLNSSSAFTLPSSDNWWLILCLIL